MLATIKEIDKLISKEKDKGTREENIFLIGFSQGGSVALSMAVASRHKLGGIVGLGTFLPHHKLLMSSGIKQDINKQIPILMISDKKDEKVPHEGSKKSYKYLQEGGWENLEFYSYEGESARSWHEFIPINKSRKVANFLRKILKKEEIREEGVVESLRECTSEPRIEVVKIKGRGNIYALLIFVLMIVIFLLIIKAKRRKKRSNPYPKRFFSVK